MMPRQKHYRTPARRVRGLGAARSGTTHFIYQRVTSISLLLLSIAFIIITVALLGRTHAAVVQILGSPLVAVLMLLFVGTCAYHMWVGMQEIIIDYIHDDGPKFIALLANTFFCFLMAATCSFAILKLSFGV